MITYRLKMLNGHFMWDAPKQKRRHSNKNKRIYDKLEKYRKSWWHFRTRWDPVNNDTD